MTFEFLQFKIHWNLKNDYENEMFYEKCKTVLIAQRNNFNHSLKKCFKSFQFIGYEKNNGKESKERSIVDVLSDGTYLLTMFGLILFLFPFFVVVYFNIFNEKNTLIKSIHTNLPENELEEGLQEILLIDIISPGKTAHINKSFETNFNDE
jgi:hypothetical protein